LINSIKNRGNIDWVHLMYLFNLTDYRDDIQEEITNCLTLALTELNDKDNHLIWGWFKQFILDSDVK